MASDKVYNILVVDDDPVTIKVVEKGLLVAPEFKCKVVKVTSAQQAMKALGLQDFDLVLSDYMMPEMNGIDFLLFVQEKYPKAARMILTAYADVDVILTAVEDAKVHGFVEKPWGKGKLTAAVYKVLTEQRT